VNGRGHDLMLGSPIEKLKTLVKTRFTSKVILFQETLEY
jgi:hypothetical protein